MNTDPNLRINEFEEKPKNPKSTLASMGIYIFNKEVLKEYLIADAERKDSDHDFGKNVIPAMLNDKLPVFAYPFPKRIHILLIYFTKSVMAEQSVMLQAII